MVIMQQDQSNDEGVITEDKPKKGATARGFKRVREPQKPGKFAVALHNDDFTPMEFVVYLLQIVFSHSSASAEAIMLKVHQKGKGVAGIYSLQIAETKVYESMQHAKENQFPLMVTAEEV